MRSWGHCFTQLFVIAGIASLASSCARPRPKPSPVTAVRPQLPPTRPATPEIRAVWVSNTDKLDWDSATRNLQRAGFNTMYVNFASGGAAFYPSRLVPAVMAGDPLAAGIRLAHQRGLAVHAKFIVTFMFKTTPDFQKRLLAADRVMRGENGRPIEQAGFYWLCPSRETNRTLAAGVLSEMLTRYPVDGVQFDYIRFNENPSCFCSHCRQEFERGVGAKLKRWPADALSGPFASRFHEWRIGLISDWVRELTTLARASRPGLTLSAAVFPDLARAREEKGQDWKAWLDRGWLNYVCIMNYTPNLADFDQRLRSCQTVVARPAQVVAGIGSWKFSQMSQLESQIAACRQRRAAGFALFSYDDAAERKLLPNLLEKNFGR